jgi:NapC/NirT cytochrome c family, N-terminal region
MANEIEPDPPRATPPLIGNWISILGVVVAASSFFAAACLIAIDLFRGLRNPYMGILTYIVAPSFLIVGLALISIGALWERRRRRRLKPGEVPAYPQIDFNIPRERYAFIAIAVVTFVFLLTTALGSYRTYEFTESVTFCGETCHQAMTPEFTAYQESPHARVACVQCHIGPGATWFVKSKLSGAYQVYATLADAYPRPIPVPVENLRPAQQTCEQCHWPRKFYGAAERVIDHYLSDEKNSPWVIRMLLKIGGGDPSFGPVGGIHWHMNIANKIEYVATDKERQVIPWVRVTDSHGKVTVYQSTDNSLKPEQIAAAEPRVMDCIDCHNRPTHIFHSPVQSVDLAISTARIDAKIPYIKEQAVTALTQIYPTTGEALRGIAEKLSAYYQTKQGAFVQANQRLLKQAIAEVQNIYARNFFPAMKVNWSVYADNIGHKDFPGCFRCHDGSHASASGKTISHDCNSCHTIIAQGAGRKLPSIAPAGLEFEHPVDIGKAWKEIQCTVCHNGALVR